MYTDMNRLSNVNTYFSDDGLRASWIDHILCSESVDKIVARIEIFYDFITFDHKPIVMQFDTLSMGDDVALTNVNNVDTRVHMVDWSKIDDYTIAQYRLHLDNMLVAIDFPIQLLHNKSSNMSSVEQCGLIDTYYDSVISAIKAACQYILPI